jgi:hypothetical protein
MLNYAGVSKSIPLLDITSPESNDMTGQLLIVDSGVVTK